jgi:hypothetical protein
MAKNSKQIRAPKIASNAPLRNGSGIRSDIEEGALRNTKSFMAVGPTLHYSHKNIQICWLLAVLIFGLCCLFFSKIVGGSILSFDFQSITTPRFRRLDQFSMVVVNIFEYPWQILVLGLLMGIFAVVPVLMSQLLSFQYSIVFILELFFLANLPAFALCVLISCVAAACRPLRFRSRFAAISLCMAPQLLYWGFYGGARGVEPIKWGFSFAPWVCAWLIALAIAGLVLGIGHFTRYRPGLVWIFTFVFFLLAVLTFEMRVGLDELDYQLFVAKNNPEHVSEFHDHSITEALDNTIKDPAVRKYLTGFFYPDEPIPLRKELKKEIQVQLSYDRWPSWFIVPEGLKYQGKKQWLERQYDLFINPPKSWWMPALLHAELQKRRSVSRRMPVTLYYKALLSEYKPDIELLGQKELLHFYNDYPHRESLLIWYRLYDDFPKSAESLESRWRIARHYAGLALFEQADELLAEAQTALAEHMKLLKQTQTDESKLFSPFRPPAESVITEIKLDELQRKIAQLRVLISPENLSADGQDRNQQVSTRARLAEFVMLNPHSQDYSKRINDLLEPTRDSAQNDPLRDNILLAQAKLIADEQRRAEQLSKLYEEFRNTDGGMQALYELALLKIVLWRQQDKASLEQKKKCLADARATLVNFISIFPNSIYTQQVNKNLESLPTVE